MKVLTDGAGSKCCCWFLGSMVNSRSLCRVNYVKFQWRDIGAGACVSYSTLLCSIYSQYTLQVGDFIFIEIL